MKSPRWSLPIPLSRIRRFMFCYVTDIRACRQDNDFGGNGGAGPAKAAAPGGDAGKEYVKDPGTPDKKNGFVNMPK